VWAEVKGTGASSGWWKWALGIGGGVLAVGLIGFVGWKVSRSGERLRSAITYAATVVRRNTRITGVKLTRTDRLLLRKREYKRLTDVLEQLRYLYNAGT